MNMIPASCVSKRVRLNRLSLWVQIVSIDVTTNLNSLDSGDAIQAQNIKNYEIRTEDYPAPKGCQKKDVALMELDKETMSGFGDTVLGLIGSMTATLLGGELE